MRGQPLTTRNHAGGTVIGILKCVRLSGERGVFVPGDEEALEAAATATELAYLEQKGVIQRAPEPEPAPKPAPTKKAAPKKKRPAPKPKAGE